MNVYQAFHKLGLNFKLKNNKTASSIEPVKTEQINQIRKDMTTRVASKDPSIVSRDRFIELILRLQMQGSTDTENVMFDMWDTAYKAGQLAEVELYKQQFAHVEQMKHEADEWECTHVHLDDLGVSRIDIDGNVYSLVGRIDVYKESSIMPKSTINKSREDAVRKIAGKVFDKNLAHTVLCMQNNAPLTTKQSRERYIELQILGMEHAKLKRELQDAISKM